jgi:hypothetical protein
VVYILPVRCTPGNKEIAPRFAAGSPDLSNSVLDCDQDNLLSDTCNTGKSAQANVYGILPDSVKFYYDVDLNQDPCALGNGRLIDDSNTGLSRTMAIEFPDVPDDPLLGFDLEDRIRFGANVEDTIGNGQIGGNEIGACETIVYICFNDGTSLMGTFVDTPITDPDPDPTQKQCLKCAGVASWGSLMPLSQMECNSAPFTAGNHGMIVHPSGTPDIPCPGPASGNNGQSLVAFNLSGGGGGGDPYAVRAQATVQVKSLFCELCGIPLGPFFVTAKETAVYDCQTRCPRLIKINPENFFCLEPAPPLP